MGNKKCVLCKESFNPSRFDRLMVDGCVRAIYEQDCPSCGSFDAEAPAIRILDIAVEEGKRTRDQIVSRFRDVVIVSAEDAQEFCYG